ncbi:MAG: LD-carboxypeptidase [Lachnospiraceae bacterium]|nr:LD-carboxypeptidase [Lachnospiraceae bacterium]
MIYPPPISKGDCIGLAAPASPISKEERDACVAALKELGFQVKLAGGLTGSRGEGIRAGEEAGDHTIWHPRYLAGDARRRAEDLNRLFHDRRVRAVFCVRGGYGSAGILPYLDYRGIRQNPKVFVGYSDITAVHMALQKHSGLVTFHGPMVKSDLIKEPRPRQWERLWDMIGRDGAMAVQGKAVFQNPDGEEIERLTGKELACEETEHLTGKGLACEETERLTGKELACEEIEQISGRDREGRERQKAWQHKGAAGTVSGRLAGGNLSVFARLAGTGYLPDLKGRILFLEDVNETVPRLHMNLLQLEQMGIFNQVQGVLLGGFTGCGQEAGALLDSFFGDRRMPVLKNIRSDHREDMGTLPMGAMCQLNPREGKCTFYRRFCYFSRVRNAH